MIEYWTVNNPRELLDQSIAPKKAVLFVGLLFGVLSSNFLEEGNITTYNFQENLNQCITYRGPPSK